MVLALCLGVAAVGGERGYYAEPALHGERLVFVSEGDLWEARVPEEPDGASIVAHRLTAGDGTESSPCFSPDGRWLAYAAEYGGNTDVYLMPAEGGAPRRLTFHPGDDRPVGWMRDRGTVLFRSARRQPLGRDELWEISPAGGMPRAFPFGECTGIALSATGRRFAFTPWSNEAWHWKGYRGGTAPDIWIGSFADGSFVRLTDSDASDRHPMWIAGRIYFLSDRDGTFNIHSDRPEGGDPRAHTRFTFDPDRPTAPDGYDARWPSADAARGARRIVFGQGAGLALLDVADDRVVRLDVTLASDRVAARTRFAPVADTITRVALSPDGGTLAVASRGELLAVDVALGAVRPLTRTPGAREWGATWVDDERLALITDAPGEQQIAIMPVDGTGGPALATDDRESWLFPPVVSPDANLIAFGDQSMRLHVIDLRTLERYQVDRAAAGEITDYRFSPDSRWLAYERPEPGDQSSIRVHAVATRRGFSVSDGRTNDREPRWDPAERYLYFLSDRALDPVVGRLEYEFAHVMTARIVAVPLTEDTPPPRPLVARAAGFDLAAWAERPGDGAEDDEPAPDDPARPRAEPGPAGGATDAMRVDPEGLAERQVLLAVEPGLYHGLEAVYGGVLYLSEPVRGVGADDDGDAAFLSSGAAILRRFSVPDEEDGVVAEAVRSYVVSGDRTTAAWPTDDGIRVRGLDDDDEDPTIVDLASVRLRVDPPAEWAQILDEAWRLQRDFFWAPNMGGVDWMTMRERYRALLPRVGTRAELNDLVAEMLGELGVSHAYVWGGARHRRDEADEVDGGLLGADLVARGGAIHIDRILPRPAWDPTLESPLAAPHLGVEPGGVLLAVDGERIGPATNVHEVLEGRAGESVRLTIANDARGAGRRDVHVTPIDDDRRLRYLDWVETRRRVVDEATDGAVGYLHLPDMGTRGLSLFSRQFLPQHRKRGLVIDVRGNGGGWVSQMILGRLARRVVARQEPRHGTTRRYPARAPFAHMAVVIDQHAGSDGDVFPAAFRALGLGPLVGTRTWGGVIGIRGDKPFLDGGYSTQPEFAWWDEHGWSIENRGVEPDVEVPLTPADRAADRDPQLDRAVGIILERLAEDPKEPPKRPPYPR